MILRQLLWKQWRENRLHLWCFTAWMALVVVYAVAYEKTHHFRMVAGSLLSWGLFYTWFGSVILAVHAGRNGSADPTNRFTAQLPVSARVYGAIRLLGAVLTLVVPLVLATLTLSLAMGLGWVEQAELREAFQGAKSVALESRTTLPTSGALASLWTIAGIVLAMGVELLLLMLLIGSRLRSQALIGLMGGALGLVMLLVSGIFWDRGSHGSGVLRLVGVLLPESLAAPAGYKNEQGSYTDPILLPNPGQQLAGSVVTLVGLGIWVVLTFSLDRRFESRRRWGWGSIPGMRWFSRVTFIPRSRFQSLLWAELRQSLPLGLLGVGVVGLATVFLMLGDGLGSLDRIGSRFLSAMPHADFAIASLWSAVVGASLFSAELEPGLGTFWRSRPISPSQWFWIKFSLGLAAVLVVVDGSTSILCWRAPREGMTGGMSWAFLACMPILHGLIYALAVYGTCRLRRPVLGGVVAVGLFLVLSVTLDLISPRTFRLEPLDIYNSLLAVERMRGPGVTLREYFTVYGGFVVLATVLGWRSSRLVRSLRSPSLGISKHARGPAAIDR